MLLRASFPSSASRYLSINLARTSHEHLSRRLRTGFTRPGSRSQGHWVGPEPRLDLLPNGDSPFRRSGSAELVAEGRRLELRVELQLGNGWYRGRLGFAGADASYRRRDRRGRCGGHRVPGRLPSERRDIPEWTATESGITRNSLYNGQTIDARLRDSSAPLEVRRTDIDRATLVAADFSSDRTK